MCMFRELSATEVVILLHNRRDQTSCLQSTTLHCTVLHQDEETLTDSRKGSQSGGKEGKSSTKIVKVCNIGLSDNDLLFRGREGYTWRTLVPLERGFGELCESDCRGTGLDIV